MFGIGMSEVIIILAVALLVLGPERLPGVAKSIAKGFRELRRASDDLRHSFDLGLDDGPRRSAPSLPLPQKPEVREAGGSGLAAQGEEHAGTTPWPAPADGAIAQGSVAPAPAERELAGPGAEVPGSAVTVREAPDNEAPASTDPADASAAAGKGI